MAALPLSSPARRVPGAWLPSRPGTRRPLLVRVRHFSPCSCFGCQHARRLGRPVLHPGDFLTSWSSIG